MTIEAYAISLRDQHIAKLKAENTDLSTQVVLEASVSEIWKSKYGRLGDAVRAVLAKSDQDGRRLCGSDFQKILYELEAEGE